MRECACGCGKFLVGKRPHAKWHSDACRERAKRRTRGSTGRIGRPPQRMYQVNEETGCWEWLLARNTGGYGLLSRGGRTQIAHRVFYVEARGLIPEGQELHHLCANRACVNPAHLESVTRAEHRHRHAAA